ncbi:unnamed protein product [Cercospora beticola]|nr:unnamed protein product [Cercospora beticola]
MDNTRTHSERRSLRQRHSNATTPEVSKYGRCLKRKSLPAKTKDETPAKDPETVEALIDETLRVLMDLHHLHQRLVRTSTSVEAGTCSPPDLHRSRQRSSRPRSNRTNSAPEERVSYPATNSSPQAVAPLPLYSSRCSSMAERSSEPVPSLTEFSSRCSPIPSSAATPPALPCKSPLRNSSVIDQGANRRDSILGPAIALCDELLSESRETTEKVEQVKGPTS